MNLNNKIVFFDFCETLVSFQTADAYVDFVRNILKTKRMVCLENFRRIVKRIKILGILERCIRGSSINKKLVLWQLKGVDYDTLDHLAKLFYEKEIRPNLIHPVIERLKSFQKQGFDIYLLSAGYDIYLKYFTEEFHLNGCICTKLGFKNKKMTGFYDGCDCYGKQKIAFLKKKFGKNSFVDMQSYALSDSRSDLPMLNACENKIVIVKKGNMKDWIKQIKAEIILWD